jgi:hypothetical protein
VGVCSIVAAAGGVAEAAGVTPAPSPPEKAIVATAEDGRVGKPVEFVSGAAATDAKVAVGPGNALVDCGAIAVVGAIGSGMVACGARVGNATCSATDLACVRRKIINPASSAKMTSGVASTKAKATIIVVFGFAREATR